MTDAGFDASLSWGEPTCRVFVLCDFAQVRAGLLFISSGGVTRFLSARYPANLNVYAAVVIEGAPFRLAEGFEVKLSLLTEDGQNLGQIAGGVQVGPARTEPGELLQTPLALPLHPVLLPHPGRYAVRLSVEKFGIEDSLSFVALGPQQSPEGQD